MQSLNHNKFSRWRRGVAWIAALLCFAAAASAANFTVSLDHDNIAVGESATLTLKFEGGSPKSPPSLPRIPNLNFSNPLPTSELTIVNGVRSYGVSYTYDVSATQPGEYTIPAMTVDVGGQTLTSQPVKLIVAAGQQTAFIRVVLPKTEVYVGEIVQAELQLYLAEAVQKINGFQMAPLQAGGFTVGKTVEGKPRQTRIGVGVYNMIPLTMPFTAVKTGTLTLGPMECNMELLFGPFDFFFGRPARVQHVTLTNEPVAIQSLPLPRNNVPPGFNGAVGNFSLTVNVSPTNVAVGDPITVKVQIAGRGALDGVTLPEQAAWSQFKVYPPTADYQPGDQLGLTGTKNFAVTVVPGSMDIKELPPFAFSFFDPEQKTYRTLTQPATPLTVRPSAASLPPPTLAGATTPAETNQAARDIVHIKPRLGTLSEIQAPLLRQPWFLTLQCVPVLAWLSLLLGRRQRERLANNPRLRRERQAAQAIRQGLQQLRQFAKANQAEPFFATAFHLLQEQIGERLDLPASSITEAVLEERLRPLRVPEETLGRVHELFQTCNQARYSRQNANGELVSLIPKVESALNELKKVKG
jgi:hypothetical protein